MTVAKNDTSQSNELSAKQIEAAKAMLQRIARKQYKKMTKSVAVMEQFRDEIVELRKSGHPWVVISGVLKEATNISISATTLRNYFSRNDGATGKKNRPESDAATPNVFLAGS
jgi:phosphoglycolate phosphatase-like HAD superfamily hydrolase